MAGTHMITWEPSQLPPAMRRKKETVKEIEQGRLAGFFSRPAGFPQGTNNQCDPNEPFVKQQGVEVGVGRVQKIPCLPFSTGHLEQCFSGVWLES